MNRLNRTLTLTAPALLLALAGCDQGGDKTSAPPPTAGDVANEVEDAAQAAGEFTANQYAALKSEMESGVEGVNDQIDALRAKATEASAATKAQIQAAIAALETQRDALMDQLESAADTTGDAWGDVKDGLGDAWRNLKDSADDAMERFGE